MLSTLSLVAAGLGVTLVPDSMRRLRVARRRLSARSIREAGLVAPLNLGLSPRRELGGGAPLYRAGPAALARPRLRGRVC